MTSPFRPLHVETPEDIIARQSKAIARLTKAHAWQARMTDLADAEVRFWFRCTMLLSLALAATWVAWVLS